MIQNLNYPIVRDINFTEQDLLDFELKIIDSWDGGKIRGPVH